jgi:hypothetical protein
MPQPNLSGSRLTIKKGALKTSERLGIAKD